MFRLASCFYLASCWLRFTAAAPAQPQGIFSSLYAPTWVDCPQEALLRPAAGLNEAEKAYIAARKPIVDRELATWLATFDEDFNTLGRLPNLAFLSSGGGYRSFLLSAGIIQAFDNRENTGAATAGLWQSMMYHAGNSGGSWLVAALAANGWQTVSALTESLWSHAFDAGLFAQSFSVHEPVYLKVIRDLLAKKHAGFDLVLNDAWGRLLSTTFIQGTDGGVAGHWSEIVESDEFKSMNHPLPILVALNVDANIGQCLAVDDAAHMEITPYEFGSWDSAIAAFTPTKYVSTPMEGGRPSGDKCVTGFDQNGYILGTSSDIFNGICDPERVPLDSVKILKGILGAAEGGLNREIGLAEYNNPFYRNPILGTDPAINNNTKLTLADGGEVNENNPVWPFIKAERPADVLFVNDNTSNNGTNFPNGNDLYTTSQRAKAHGLTRMPEIPPPDYFNSVHNRPTFFGCHTPETLTIIYLPNRNYTFPSNVGSLKEQFTAAQTKGMLGNGVAIATMNGDKDFPLCMACAVMAKSDTKLPGHCHKCFDTYCYN